MRPVHAFDDCVSNRDVHMTSRAAAATAPVDLHKCSGYTAVVGTAAAVCVNSL